MVNKSPSVLVCGTGSIGQRHIKNLQSLNVNVSAWRNRSELAEELSKKFDIIVHADLECGLEQADAVVIATSTNTHIDIALKAAKQGKAIYIEKPIAKSFSEIAPLVSEISNKNIIEVGFQLRAHPNLVKIHEILRQKPFGPLYTYRAVVGHRLDRWRPDTNYRECYSASIKYGGGALLDLIHEIDLVHWLTGDIEKIYGNISQVSDLEMSTDDLANLTLMNKNGSIGQIQMDMVSPNYRRGLELVYRDAIICWDYMTGTIYKKKDGVQSLIDEVPKTFEKNTMFIKLMRNFIERVNGELKPPFCSLEDAIVAQKIAESARTSSMLERVVMIDEITL
jgi:predicted dehydrogenase